MIKLICAIVSAVFSYAAYSTGNDTFITVSATFAAAALMMEHTTHQMEKHK